MTIRKAILLIINFAYVSYQSIYCKKKQLKVISTVGAGDSFTATAIVGLLLNCPLQEINEHANKGALYVCTQTGAVPQLQNHLTFIE